MGSHWPSRWRTKRRNAATAARAFLPNADHDIHHYRSGASSAGRVVEAATCVHSALAFDGTGVTQSAAHPAMGAQRTCSTGAFVADGDQIVAPTTATARARTQITLCRGRAGAQVARAYVEDLALAWATLRVIVGQLYILIGWENSHSPETHGHRRFTPFIGNDACMLLIAINRDTEWLRARRIDHCFDDAAILRRARGPVGSRLTGSAHARATLILRHPDSRRPDSRHCRQYC